jgi:DNA-binding NtrC family response regulator
MNHPAVIIFEKAPQLRASMTEGLASAGFGVIQTSEKGQLMRCLDSEPADTIVLGPSSIGPDHSLELARQVREFAARVPLVLIVLNSSEDVAIAALRAGVDEYVKFPFHHDELIASVNHCLEKSQTAGSYVREPPQFDGIVGDSAAMRDIRGRISKLALSDSNVLITGETGTGKELVAQVVRDRSLRRSQPFVSINCAAIPDTLLESELFGYAKGAFSGADSIRDGKLKAADKGTVFLDEIGDMSSSAQAKILRLIESKEVQRLGCNHSIPVDIRIIAATNQDLEQLARENKFRRDLFFRLNVARIHLPPLRERKEDLVALTNYYIAHFNRRFGRKVCKISGEAMACLLPYDWPGNIRELKNLLESVFVDGASQDISQRDLPLEFRHRAIELKAISGDERERLLWALSITNWNKSRAADRLNWSRMTLYRKMARYKISPSGNLRMSA